jgi:hypothetical protein
MERSYFYTGDPSTVRPEPGLGRFRYGTRSEGLYDLASDPLRFRTLAAEANRTPFTAKYNKGVADPSQAFTDVERMAKEYGYEGLMNPQQGTAIMYKPTPVQPFARGGAVMPAAKIGGEEFVRAADKYGLLTDNATLNQIVDLVNRGLSVDEAAKMLARGPQDQFGRETTKRQGGLAAIKRSR